MIGKKNYYKLLKKSIKMKKKNLIKSLILLMKNIPKYIKFMRF